MDTTKFFESIKHVLEIENEKIKQADMRGENYNIFDVVNLTTDEVKLHSSFIADLLSPLGKHGLGTKPLELFLEIIGISADKDDLSDCLVKREHHIGPISEDYSEGGNIDILIRLPKQIIVIENKIYAGDQPKQMVRYKNFAKRSNHKLLYLTLDGHEPSESSRCEMQTDVDYTCISYADEISRWLEKCKALTINRPLIREILQQYIKTIQSLTYTSMNESNKESLFSKMDEYPEVVKAIISEEWYYRYHIVHTYIIKPLKEWCKNKGFEWYEDEGFKNQGKYTGFGFHPTEWKRMIAVEFSGSNFSGADYGVWDPEGKLENMPLILGNDSTKSWPYGWENLGKFSNWGINIATEIISGEVVKFLISKFEQLYSDIVANPKKFPMN